MMWVHEYFVTMNKCTQIAMTFKTTYDTLYCPTRSGVCLRGWTSRPTVPSGCNAPCLCGWPKPQPSLAQPKGAPAPGLPETPLGFISLELGWSWRVDLGAIGGREGG